MFQRTIKPLLAFLIGISTQTPLLAQLAQEPLLNKPNSVAPNLTLILDTSGSMSALNGTYIYQFGLIDPSGMGPQGPATRDRAKYSPDVNRIYYDPRVRYLPRVNSDGTPIAQNPPTTTVGLADTVVWEVWFRNSTVAAADTGVLSEYYNPNYLPNASLVATPLNYPNQVTLGFLAAVGSKFPKFLKRTDCVTPTLATATWCTATEEAQNHSNWKKWYSFRGDMAKTGLGAAFQPLKADSIRFGWSTISNLDDNLGLDRGVSSYSDAAGDTKDQFFSWLYTRNFAQGTPNLPAVDRVGKYYERTDSDGPWSTLPNPASRGTSTVTTPVGPGKTELPASHASCRRSYSMLVTDGYWNDRNAARPNVGNVDKTTAAAVQKPPSNIPTIEYTPVFPYKDDASNTLADIVMKYWVRDLRPDLSNRVPKISANGIDNPSYWQNVSFYAITLGLDGTLPRTPATLASLTAGTTPWPVPAANQPSTIDDTWHATINGRGELLNANNSSELTSGLRKMFDTIAGTPQSLSGVALSTTVLKSGTRKYKPEYVSGTWSGRLSSIELDLATGNDKVPSNVFWEVEKNLDPTLDPISTIPNHSSRNIVTWSGSAGVAFNAANTGLTTNLVNYLRSDSSLELRNGGTYRNRATKLGDVINSAPVLVKDNVNLAYDKLVPALGDYKQFIADKAARPEGVLFVGANDGMVHAIRDSNGAETFAFVPKAVVPNLYKLADIPFTHQYLVDGPMVETDAYLGGAWMNLVLGTTGAGAQSVYALNTTNPLSMSASNVLWEVNSSTSGFSDLGYVLTEVQSGVLPSGDWVAIFGNGVASASGVARLYVVNLQTGALLKDISTSVGGGNGLTGIRVVRDATQRIVGAYAGDLKGNMWKFDLTGASTNWKVGLSGNPLFAGSATQPITAQPAVLPHPNGGYVVAFGTGKFYQSGDATDLSKSQRIYGIWDAQPFGAASTPVGATVTGIGALVEQTIDTVPVGSPPVNYFKVSGNTVGWGDGLTTGSRGWFIKLLNSGERLTYPIDRLLGTHIVITTISPASATTADAACVQTGSGSGWTYIFDGVTGSGPTKPTLDTNGDGLIDAFDAIVSGVQDPVDGIPKSISTGSGTETGCLVTAQNLCVKWKLSCGQVGMPSCPPGGTGGIKSREWRQLFMR